MKNNSFYRIFIIVSMSIKFFLQVYFFHKRHQLSNPAHIEKWNELLLRQAREYKRNALKLEGLLIKLGQFLSTRADLLPEVFLDELGDLVDRVPPVPHEKIQQVLKSEWGEQYDSFIHFESETAIASASIGQVYKATLTSGEEVAVKVQRPNIERIIQTDFKALKIVFFLARKWTTMGKKSDLPALYNEILIIIGNELDFLKELENGEYFQAKYHDNDAINIPQYYRDYTTKRILVMEWIEGSKISDSRFFETHHINRKEVAKNLFEAFVSQLLFDGKFHADPHQGNILIKEDGTIVLIDFGMVGELTSQDAVHLRKLVTGFTLGDFEMVVDSLDDLHFLLPNSDHALLVSILKRGTDLYFNENFSSLQFDMMESILEDLQKFVNEQPIQMPAQFAFLGRAASTLVGVLSLVDPEIDLLVYGKPIVMKWLKEQKDTSTSVPSMLINAVRPLLSLPTQWVEEPERQRAFEEKLLLHKEKQQYFVQQKWFQFIFSLLSVGFFITSMLFLSPYWMIGSGVVSFVSIIFFYRTNQKHKKHLSSFTN